MMNKTIEHHTNTSLLIAEEYSDFKATRTFKDLCDYDYKIILEAYLNKGWVLTGEANTTANMHTIFLEYIDNKNTNIFEFEGNLFQFFEYTKELHNTGYELTTYNIDIDGNIKAEFKR